MKQICIFFLVVILPLLLDGQNFEKAQKRFSVNFNENFQKIESAQMYYGNEVANTENAGIAPNGDLISDVAITPNGALAFSANRWTNNVSVFDLSNGQQVEIIDVEGAPLQLAATNNDLFVALFNENKLCRISLDDFEEIEYLDIEGPEVMKLSAASNRLFISSSVSKKCIVLDALTCNEIAVIPNIDFLTIPGGASTGANNRTGNAYLHYSISPDGNYLSVLKDFSSVQVYSAETGELILTTETIPGLSRWSFSGNSQILIYVVRGGASTTIYRHYVGTDEVLSEVTLENFSLASGFGNVGSNGNGTKLIVPGSQQDIYYDHNENTVTPLASYRTKSISQVTADSLVFISGSNIGYVFDFETGSMVGQADGAYFANIDAASATHANMSLTYEGLLYEKIYVFQYTKSEIEQPFILKPGNTQEGDAPNHLAINPQGTKAYVANALSGNISVVDLETGLIQKTLDVNFSASMVKFTSDGNYAVVTGCGPIRNNSANSNTIIIDALTDEIVKNIPTTDYSSQIAFDNNEEYAFITSSEYGVNEVSIIHLAGANSEFVSNVNWGQTGCFSIRKGDFSAFRTAPNSNYLFFMAYTQNQQQAELLIIDPEQRAIVEQYNLGEQAPLALEFNNHGTKAVAICWNKLFVFDVNESVLTLLASQSSPDGENFQDVYYDKENERFLVTGSYSGWIALAENDWSNSVIDNSVGAVIQDMTFDLQNDPMYLLSSDNGTTIFKYNEEEVTLPAKYYRLKYHANSGVVVTTAPGPDFVTTIYVSPIGIGDVITSGQQDLEVIVAPNPARNHTTINYSIENPNDVSIMIFDINGTCVRGLVDRFHNVGMYTEDWNLQSDIGAKLPAGTYYLRLIVGKSVVTKPIIVVK